MKSPVSSPSYSKSTTDRLLQSEILSMSRSMIAHKKPYKLNLFDNTLTTELDRTTREEEKLKEFLQEDFKDIHRYNQIKDRMMRKFFKIKIRGDGTTRKETTKPIQSSVQITHPHQSKISSTFNFQLDKTKKLSNKNQINNQVSRILQASDQLVQSTKSNTKHKVKTKSQLDRKHREEVNEERKLIMKFIKKSSSVDFNQKKWEQLSNRDKYLMNFTEYMKKKTKSAIESDVYQKKIMKKTTKMQQFQDFILQQVKFSADNKQKLSHFFKQVRWQFKRIQNNQKVRNVEFKRQYIHSRDSKRPINK